ncbi:MAG: DUF4131 domain-containing protein [Alphaproteobacteria bacterium]|nr:DUF4131 domain-containing protein [Alphaproteobacteria bacterium]
MAFTNPIPALAARLLEERDRWPLWAPVAMGLGVGVYFALPFEPWRAVLSAAPLALAAGLFAQRLGAPGYAWMGLFFALLGFNAAQLSAILHAGPMVDYAMHGRMVQGRVLAIDAVEGKSRLLLDRLEVQYLAPSDTPARVRITVKQPPAALPRPGARIELKASLSPMSGPVAPGAYDFRRHGYFDGRGAVGWARGDVKVLERPEAGGLDTLAETLRTVIAERVDARLEGDSAAVTTALLNGEQTGIGDAAMAAMRASGLVHLLSISGVHIGLVAGLVFFAVRGLLALVPFLALRFPIKKWAAAVALAAILAYTWLVGAPVPTVRSALMTGIVLLAVLVDRRALSMRLIALAAAVVLLLFPHAMLGPSFQMSFAAVLGMIAVYESRQQDWLELAQRRSPFWRGILYLGGIAGTSVIATAMTTPFTLYHFQVMNWYGVVANMLAVPLTGFWIMPAALLSYLLMPLGLEGWAVTVMGWGVEAMLAIARTVAAWPGAVATIPLMPPAALLAIVAGGLWLCLWRTGLRWFGLCGVALGLGWMLAAPRPDILVDEGGKVWAARLADGRMAFGGARAGNFVIGQWQQQDGGTEFIAFRDAIKAGARDLMCQKISCYFMHGDTWAAFIRDPKMLKEACAVATLVVTPYDAYECLESGAPAIDRPMLNARGAHAVYLEDGGMRTVGVRRRAGARPWAAGWRGWGDDAGGRQK